MDDKMYLLYSEIVSDSRFTLYKAQIAKTGEDVILKTPKNQYPSAQTKLKLKEEFELLKKLNYPGIVKPINLVPFRNSSALLFEEVKGTTLSTFIGSNPFDLQTFYAISKPLVKALKKVHENRIIHKNINSNSIMIEEGLKPVVTGFNIATEISREMVHPTTREAFDANLAFISPEQTARINKGLDQRTDFYSLGVVFYHLLTSRLPFITDDPLEMMHSHIAKHPVMPHIINPEVPLILSQIVMRMLAKNVEERYQSASGLLFDIRQSEKILLSNQENIVFNLGEQDVFDQFRIPDKIYGREKEKEKLLEAYREASTGNAKLVFVSGYSGVGKSVLVKELREPVIESSGYFISGKFDQYSRDVPFAPLFIALSNLFRQLLSESAPRISDWKERLLKAVGNNGKIIIDVIPEIELIIGKQPDVNELPPQEANNRFNRVFTRVLQVFAQPQHPLCIFIDDLQWIDSATRQWIERQFTEQKFNHLLMIGAFRDNEITSSHPVMFMLDRLQQNSVDIDFIHLKPLKQEILNQLVSDLFKRTEEECSGLSGLVFRKTMGNPFFTRQCLLSLYENKAIFFNTKEHIWDFDLIKAEQAEISDNVMELMLDQIKLLPIPAQDLLKTASLAGNVFSLELLSSILNQDEEIIASQVLEAQRKGLIRSLNAWDENEPEKYVFLHDRVKQAALSLSDENEKQKIRLRIGEILSDNTVISEDEDKIYEIADHFNFALGLITDSQRKEELVDINYAASLRAKRATAYEQALYYIKKAIDILPANAFEYPFRNSSKILLQRAECEHLCGNNQAAESFYDMAVNHATDVEEKTRVHQLKIHYYSNLREFRKAYDTGRDAIKQLGVSLPAKFAPPQIIKEIATYLVLSRGKKTDDILHMKEMSDKNLKMAVSLMATIGRAAYQIQPELCVVVCARIVNICLKHGNTDGIYIGYLALGPIFLGAILKRKKTGFDIGKLTLDLAEKYNSTFYRAETNFVVGYFAVPWVKPALEMEKHYQVAYEAGLEAGDYFHTSCACCGTIQSYFMRGVEFDEIMNAANRYLDFLKRIDNQEAILTIQSVTQSILNLRGETESRYSFSNENFDEIKSIEQYNSFNSRHFAHYYYINKMQSLYLWGNVQEAHRISTISDTFLKDSPGMLHTAEHFFYKGLILCAMHENLLPKEKSKNKNKIKNIVNRFKKFVKGNLENFSHKFYLLEAEFNRISGSNEEATKKYYEAISAAKQYGYTNILALSNQLLANHLTNIGRSEVAGFHIREAIYAYKTLGAIAYVEELTKQYPGLTEYKSDSRELYKTSRSGISDSIIKTDNLDLTTILKSSQAISKEIQLDDLLSALFRILIENAGAERVVLLINRNSKFVVKAEFSTGMNEVKNLGDIPIEDYPDVPLDVVNYVARTKEHVILDSASENESYNLCRYFRENKILSVLCAPLIKQGELTGVIYLENNLTNSAFTQERIDTLLLLSSQMAISIENAFLYENLEEKVKERTFELNEEKNKSEKLLLNILPSEIAVELKNKGTVNAKYFKNVSVLFTDFNNFTSISEKMDAEELVREINYYYTAFDEIISKYGIEKIKTIGDSYMCAAGIPVEKETNPFDMVYAALELRDFVNAEKNRRKSLGMNHFEMRIGINTGPVVAGIVGLKKFAYDIWGDSVNIASRMESNGESGKINISGSTYEVIKDQFECIYRGKIDAKHKGMIDMYFLEGVKINQNASKEPEFSGVSAY